MLQFEFWGEATINFSYNNNLKISLNCKRKHLKTVLLQFIAFSFFGCILQVPVCAYETVEATTVIPKKNASDIQSADTGTAQHTPFLGFDRSLKRDDLEVLNRDRKEISIPNPLDELTLRKIRALGAQSSAPSQKEEKSDITIDSKELEYFDDTGELEARGSVVINAENGTVLTADKAVYDKNANTVKLYDNVTLTKGANTVFGDYMLIDLNEENAIMDAPTANIGATIKVKAQEGFAYADRIEAVNGSVDLAKKIEMCLRSGGFDAYENMLIRDEDVSFDIKRQRLSPYKIKAKEVLIESRKDHDSFTLKNADLYYKKFKLLTVNTIELFADKEMNYVEANVPLSIGSLNDFGEYVGLGYTFKLPAGANLRVAPALVYDDDLGVGAFATLKTKRLKVDAAWATSSENLILDGEYRFTPKIRAEFGRHAYKDEDFLGSKRAGHLAQLVYDDTFNVKDLNAIFKQRFTAGYASDYVKKHQEDNNFGTMRLRWQSQLSKSIFGVSNKEQDMTLDFGAYAQTVATLYGTGDTFGLVRGGPYISSRIKNWKSNIGYAIGGTHGRSPFKFDEYTYGKSAIDIDESLKLCKYLSLGYRGTISPLEDNSDGDLLTENRFYAIIGPEDAKLALSYDTIRKNASFNVMFMVGTDTTDITYEKLTVKDPDKLQKKKEPVILKDLPYHKIKVPENL